MFEPFHSVVHAVTAVDAQGDPSADPTSLSLEGEGGGGTAPQELHNVQTAEHAGSAPDAGGVLLDAASIEAIRQCAPDHADELLDALVQSFVDQWPQLLDAIRQGANGGPMKDAERTAHTLKSSSAQLGAMALSDVSRRLEYAARAGEQEQLGALTDCLVAEFERAREALLRLVAGARRASGPAVDGERAD